MATATVQNHFAFVRLLRRCRAQMLDSNAIEWRQARRNGACGYIRILDACYLRVTPSCFCCRAGKREGRAGWRLGPRFCGFEAERGSWMSSGSSRGGVAQSVYVKQVSVLGSIFLIHLLCWDLFYLDLEDSFHKGRGKPYEVLCCKLGSLFRLDIIELKRTSISTSGAWCLQ